MSDKELQNVTKRERRVRLFGLIVLAAPPPILVGCALMIPFFGDAMGVGPVQRVAIGLALAVPPLAIAICRRESPQGRLLVAVRRAFFTTYAALAVAAILAVLDELAAIYTIPIYFIQIVALHALYERCVKPWEGFRKK